LLLRAVERQPPNDLAQRGKDVIAHGDQPLEASRAEIANCQIRP
jgi:hypothetical protein